MAGPVLLLTTAGLIGTVFTVGPIGGSGRTAPEAPAEIPHPDVLLPDDRTTTPPGSEAPDQPIPWHPADEELLGVWLQVAADDFRGLLVEFDDDGRFTMGSHGRLLNTQALDGSWQLDDGPIHGSWQLHGSMLRLHAPPDLGCSGQLHVPERGGQPTSDGGFDLTITDDGGSIRCAFQPDTQLTMARVSPDPAIELPAQASTEQDGRPATFADLAGIWLQVGDDRWRGLLLALQLNGTFVADGGGDLTGDPELRGTWATDPGGVLSLTGDELSRCRIGNDWTLYAEVLERGLLDVVIDEADGAICLGPVGTRWTFVRLSPYSAASRHLTPVP